MVIVGGNRWGFQLVIEFPSLCIHEGCDEILEARKAYPQVYWAFWHPSDNWRGCLWVRFSFYVLAIHVSVLRQYVPNKSHVLKCDTIELDDRLSFVEEPIVILTIVVSRLCSRVILVFKVCWRHSLVEEATSETEHQMREKFPRLFETSGTLWLLLLWMKVIFRSKFFNEIYFILVVIPLIHSLELSSSDLNSFMTSWNWQFSNLVVHLIFMWVLVFGDFKHLIVIFIRS